MNVTLFELVVWAVVGGIAGTLTGMLVTRTREGFGRWRNLAVGMVGALIGGLLFRVFGISLGLDKLVLRADDLIAAVLGSLVLLGGVWIYRKKRGAKQGG